MASNDSSGLFSKEFVNQVKYQENLILAIEYVRRNSDGISYSRNGYFIVGKKLALATVNIPAHYNKYHNLSRINIPGVGNKSLKGLKMILEQRMSGKRVKLDSAEALVIYQY